MMSYHSFIFVHLEKCAGTMARQLIYNALKNNVNYDSSKAYIPGITHVEEDNLIYLQKDALEKLAQKNYYCVIDHSHYGFAEKALGLKNPFYFTILREPLARFLSHYYFFSIYENNIGKNIPDLNKGELKKVLQTGVPNLMTLKLSGELHWNEAMDYTEKLHILEKSLPIAKKNLSNMDAFGILESMSDSFKLLNKVNPFGLNIDYHESQRKLNQSPGKKAVNDEFIDQYKEYGRFDIELYQFALAEFSKRIETFGVRTGSESNGIELLN